ncbi:MAG: HAMP domain-containing histidine kinase, partial [Oscillospiraceae bacterium]|nr:HAMP domain-containing histidine kinase [Oscillospiraceae bacterium]
DGTIPPEQQEHYLKIVSMEINRLARLVRSMLNISKYEAGELDLTPESFDIIPIIFRTLLNFEKRIDEKKVDIRGLDRDAFFVKADKDLIQQVVYNLVENAVKFVNKGGYIEFLFAENEETTSVTVRNSGEGLKENEISRVFERFYKTDESRGIDPGGVGLGLSIVRSLIKLHGGTILVRSQYEQYVEFEFSLLK